jgi:hypothetical protein
MTMSIFRDIMSRIFKSATPASTATPSEPSAQQASTTAPTIEQVDVEVVLTKLADRNDDDLDWRKSIVDLMKLLNLDSSLAARKQLARELHYTGNMNETAPMNRWLHKQVMRKLAENGGKVPAEILAR